MHIKIVQRFRISSASDSSEERQAAVPSQVLSGALIKAFRRKNQEENQSDDGGMRMFWNHNSVYYPWIQKKTENCRTILDVGCGDGTLVFFLNDGTKEMAGIDTDMHSIQKAVSATNSSNLHFSCCSFEDYTPDKPFDAIVFVASIHHMDMTESLQKAKSLLSPSGRLLIVGLAAPSGIFDWVLEAARAIPSKAISSFHHMQTSEELGIKTAYNLPFMKDVRRIVKQELPGATIHYALHYRYLLEWTNRSFPSS